MSTTITSPKLNDLKGRLAKLRSDIATVRDEAGRDLDLTNVKSVPGTPDEIAEQVKSWATEANDLGEQISAEEALVKALQGSIDAEEIIEQGLATPDAKGTWAHTMIKGGALDLAQKGKKLEHDISLKTLMSTAAGWAPEPQLQDRVLFSAQRPVELIDLIPQTTTSETNAVTYMEETTFTNAAAETAEGAQKPEAELAYTKRLAEILKIAVTLNVTDEQLKDVPRITGIIQNRLPFMVMQRLSLQIAAGDGTGENFTGILNVSGTQTQALGTDTLPDAILKALGKVQTVGQASPNVIVMNPSDWQKVRLSKDASDNYLWGPPSEAGPARIWGVPVVQAQAVTAGTAVVGDFANYSELAVRESISTQLGYNGEDFRNNQQTFRTEMRAALMWLRPAAFCTVTGIV